MQNTDFSQTVNDFDKVQAQRVIKEESKGIYEANLNQVSEPRQAFCDVSNKNSTPQQAQQEIENKKVED